MLTTCMIPPPDPCDTLPIGDPLAEIGIAGTPSLSSADVAICMGRLVGDHSSGPASCDLVTLTRDPGTAASCSPTLTLDDNRGGGVDANGDVIVTSADNGQIFPPLVIPFRPMHTSRSS